jgi:DNA-binding transcriptional LysR family regulator
MDRLAIDLRLLEPFVVVADELHFTRAAARLHIAQPALSQQIRRLERQVGSPLFTRPPEPIALTAAGSALLAGARLALADVREGIEQARALAHGLGETVRLGHLSSLSARFVPALAEALRDEEHPLTLSARESSVEEQLADLRSGMLHFGLFYLDRDLALPGDPIELEAIGSGPHLVALPRTHPLARRPRVAFEELADETWVLPTGTSVPGYQAAFFHATCARHGFVPRIGQQANSIDTMLGMVAAGFGVAPAPWVVALRPTPEVALPVADNETFDLVAAHAGRVSERGGFVSVARQVVAGLIAELP